MAVLDSGAVTVTIYPEWDYQQPREKIQASSRGTNGNLYQYKFDEYRTFKFKVSHVSNDDMLTINQWWRENVELTFTAPNGTNYNVVITNKKEPLAKNSKPYDTLWEGVLEMSEYD